MAECAMDFVKVIAPPESRPAQQVSSSLCVLAAGRTGLAELSLLPLQPARHSAHDLFQSRTPPLSHAEPDGRTQQPSSPEFATTSSTTGTPTS